jgi:hypothetical protein
VNVKKNTSCSLEQALTNEKNDKIKNDMKEKQMQKKNERLKKKYDVKNNDVYIFFNKLRVELNKIFKQQNPNFYELKIATKNDPNSIALITELCLLKHNKLKGSIEIKCHYDKDSCDYCENGITKKHVKKFGPRLSKQIEKFFSSIIDPK